jgi:hypothetical protein
MQQCLADRVGGTGWIGLAGWIGVSERIGSR